MSKCNMILQKIGLKGLKSAFFRIRVNDIYILQRENRKNRAIKRYASLLLYVHKKQADFSTPVNRVFLDAFGFFEAIFPFFSTFSQKKKQAQRLLFS